MTLRTVVQAGLSAAGMLVLILDGKTALAGASAGMELCIRTVIPSLFPFLFLCTILTGALWGGNYPMLHRIGQRLGIPHGAESLLIAAVLGGYPAGAQAIGEAFRGGRLTKADAQHLLSFCSNAGPAFLFGMTALQFPRLQMIWGLWGIQILSALMTGSIGRYTPKTAASLPPRSGNISHILTVTVKTMATICGWILLFQILTTFLNQWFLWFLPTEIQVILAGILELSNGCCLLNQIESIPLRFVICSGFLSFGGICVSMQTASLIGDLSMKAYLRGKILQVVFSTLLSILYLQLGWTVLMLVGLGILVFPDRRKKTGGFPHPSGV